MYKESDAMGKFIAKGDVVFVRQLQASIGQVWAYLTEPEKRARWLAVGAMDLRPGGRVELRFRHSDLSAPGDAAPEKYRRMSEQGCLVTGEVTCCEPPRLLGFTWREGGEESSASEVTFELEPVGDTTQLTLRHRRLGDDPEARASVGAGWHTHLSILSARLSQKPAPQFWATHTRWEAEYLERGEQAAKKG